MKTQARRPRPPPARVSDRGRGGAPRSGTRSSTAANSDGKENRRRSDLFPFVMVLLIATLVYASLAVAMNCAFPPCR